VVKTRMELGVHNSVECDAFFLQWQCWRQKEEVQVGLSRCESRCNVSGGTDSDETRQVLAAASPVICHCRRKCTVQWNKTQQEPTANLLLVLSNLFLEI